MASLVFGPGLAKEVFSVIDISFVDLDLVTQASPEQKGVWGLRVACGRRPALAGAPLFSAFAERRGERSFYRATRGVSCPQGREHQRWQEQQKSKDSSRTPPPPPPASSRPSNS